jgi:translocation and assembly module TamB
VAIARGGVELAKVALIAPKAKLALSVDGNLKQGVVLGVAGKASADLLTPLVPGVRELYGDMDVQLRLAPGAADELEGSAELRDGYVRLGSGQFLRKLGGKLVLDGRRVRVEDASAAFGGGVLRAGGTLDVRGARVVGYELELGADGVAFEPQDRFTVALDAAGRLRWQEGSPAPKLEGRVLVNKLVYGRHVQLPDAVIAFNRDERARSHDAARDRVLLDVEVEHEQPLLIRNNFLDAEVAVVGKDRKLRITGSDQRFGLLGKLEVLRGRVLYRGDEFRITQGMIAFDDPQRVAPDFELRAVAEKRKRKDAQILLWTRGNRHTFDLQVRCEANGGAPPPFTCDFRDNRLRCDSLDDLVRLWVCRPEAALSSAP